MCIACSGPSTQLSTGSVVDSFYVDQSGRCQCRDGYLLDDTRCIKCHGHGAFIHNHQCSCQKTQVPPAPVQLDAETCSCPSDYGWSETKCFSCKKLGYDYYDETMRSCQCGVGADYNNEQVLCIPQKCPKHHLNFYQSSENRWTCMQCSGPGSAIVDDQCTCTKKDFMLDANNTCIRIPVMLPMQSTTPPMPICSDDTEPFYKFRQFYYLNEETHQCELQTAEFSFIILLLLLLLLLPFLCIQCCCRYYCKKRQDKLFTEVEDDDLNKPLTQISESPELIPERKVPPVAPPPFKRKTPTPPPIDEPITPKHITHGDVFLPPTNRTEEFGIQVQCEPQSMNMETQTMDFEEPIIEEAIQENAMLPIPEIHGEIEIPIIVRTSTTQHACFIEWATQEHVSYYMISILKLGADISTARQAEKLDKDATQAVLDNLEPGTQYTVLLTAFDRNNKYKNSEHLIVETAGIPPSRPQRLVFQQVSANALQVSWGEPEFLNGVLSGYILEWSNADEWSNDTRQSQKIPIPRPKQRSTTITNLVTQTEYHISVSAVNQHGVSKSRSGRYFLTRVRNFDTDSIEMGPVSQHQSLIDLSQQQPQKPVDDEATVLTRKIAHIEQHLQLLFHQEKNAKEQLQSSSNLEVQQELTYIQQNIYEQKQVLSQLRMRLERLTTTETHVPTQTNIPIILTEDVSEQDFQQIQPSSTKTSDVNQQIQQSSTRETIKIQTTKQEFIISQYERRGVESATSYQTVQDELAARFRQKEDENSIERMEQRHRYQKLDDYPSTTDYHSSLDDLVASAKKASRKDESIPKQDREYDDSSEAYVSSYQSEAEFDPTYTNYEETEHVGLLDDCASSTAGYTASHSRSSVLTQLEASQQHQHNMLKRLPSNSVDNLERLGRDLNRQASTEMSQSTSELAKVEDERFKQEMATNAAMFRKSTTEVYDKFTQQNTTKRTVYENMGNVESIFDAVNSATISNNTQNDSQSRSNDKNTQQFDF